MVVMDTGLFTGEQPMSDAWKTFRDFVERTDDLPIGMLVSNATARGMDDDVIAAYEAPFPAAEAKAGARAFPLMLPTTPEMPGAAAGKRVLEALRTDERPKLHLWADSDPIIPFKVGERFAAAINADPPEKIDNASHFLQEDAGEEIGRRIAAWLDGVAMTGPLYRLGGFCARHAKIVFPLWILIVIGVSLGANATGSPTSDDTTIPGSDSTRATNLLEDKLPSQANGSVPIVVESKQGKLTTGANKTAVQKTVDDLKANQYVRSLVNPLEQAEQELARRAPDARDHQRQPHARQRRPGRRRGEFRLRRDQARQRRRPRGLRGRLPRRPALLAEHQAERDRRHRRRDDRARLRAGHGAVDGDADPHRARRRLLRPGADRRPRRTRSWSRRSLRRSRSCSGSGVGVDYSLFIVSRYRALFDGGMEYKEAVARAVATSGGAVLFAGSTVVISLLCLYFGGIPQVQELGYSARDRRRRGDRRLADDAPGRPQPARPAHQRASGPQARARGGRDRSRAPQRLGPLGAGGSVATR